MQPPEAAEITLQPGGEAEPKRSLNLVRKRRLPNPDANNYKFKPVPLRERTHIRTLYLVHGLQPREIAHKLGGRWTSSRVTGLCRREGWIEQKRAISEQTRALVEARTQESNREIAEAIAYEAEELTFGALEMTRESIDARDPKAAQMASGTVRNLAAVARDMRGPTSAGGTTQVNVYVSRFTPRAGDDPVAEAKQVTEIESKPVA